MSEAAQAAKALVFMTARNCEMYAASSLSSLACQVYDNLHVLYIDDCSDDATGAIARRHLSSLFPGKHTFIRNSSQFGKARNVWTHLRPLANKADFIAVLDGDDQLIDVGIFAALSQRYAAGKDVVWTNYVTDTGMSGGNAALDPNISPRGQGWKTSHFFTFRAELLKRVPEGYFKNRAGEWLMAACDMALAFPILDQTRHYEFMPVAAYRYTASNPYSHHNLDPHAWGLNSTIQRSCAAEVLSMPPLPVRQSLHVPPAPTRSSARPATGPATMPMADVWASKAADLLIVACPALLNAHAVLGSNLLNPMQIWSLFQAISRMKGEHILHVGATSSALYLAGIVASLPNVELICLCGPDAQARDLEARLAAAALCGRVAVEAAAEKKVSVGDTEGWFVDVGALAGKPPFSLVLVDTRGHEREADYLNLALPMMAPSLSRKGFQLFLLSEDRETLARIAGRWGERTSGMTFCLDAVAGGGLAIIGG